MTGPWHTPPMTTLSGLPLRKLLESVAPDKLWLSADCGYSQTARGLSVDKMRALVAGARIVREELGAGR